MKVLQSGGQPWACECVCKNCQAKLLVEYADVYKRLISNGYYDIYGCYFSCPECLEETHINYDGLNEKLIPFRTDQIYKSSSIFSFFTNLLNK